MIMMSIDVTATRVSKMAVAMMYRVGPITEEALVMKPKKEKNSPAAGLGRYLGKEATGQRLASADYQAQPRKPFISHW